MNIKFRELWPVVGVALLLALMPAARGAVRTWSMAPSFVFVNTLLLAGFLFRGSSAATLGDGTPGFRFRWIDAWILGFIALAAGSFFVASYKHDSLFALLRLCAYGGVYYWLSLAWSGAMFRRLLGFAVAVGAGLSLYGFLQYFAGLDHSWWRPNEFLAATYVNHNHFAGYLEMTIPIALGMALSRRMQSWEVRIWLVLGITLMGTAFIFTQSRGAWVSLSISLVMMSLVLTRRGILRPRHLLIVAALGVAVLSFLVTHREEVAQRADTMTAGEPDQESARSRLAIWEGVVKMVAEAPLWGVGIGNFDAAYQRFRPKHFNLRATYAHNDYLQMAAEMGALAPVLMLLIVFSIIATGIRMGDHPLVLGCAAGVLNLALHGWVDFNFHIPANMLLLTVCAAYVMRPRKERAC